MTMTITDTAPKIRSGQLSPLQLLEQCFDAIDKYEAMVNAWVLVDRERARADAERLSSELQQGFWRGPLHGIPIAIKDIIDVFDWPTASGSKLWANSIARQDADVVRRLREAGAVIMGKTVTTQFASFDPPPTRNPWNLERTPGGSSSGSAAAVACGMCVAAMGSQTGGSITRPASFCGVAGLKPSYGLVSLDGILPLAPSMDHPGPMANCVEDLAILLSVLASTPGYVDTAPIPKLCVVGGIFEDMAEPVMRDLMTDVVAKLTHAGANITRVSLPSAFSEVLSRHRTVMAVEAAVYHEERLRRHPEDYEPNIRALIEEGINTSAPDYARSLELQQRLRDEMFTCFAGKTFLLMPATLGPAPDKATTGDPAFNSPWSFTGLPSVSIPTGWSSDGMPLAVQIVGADFRDDELLDTAAWCEKVIAFEQRELKLV
ncbi:MAG: amidase [Gemmataceae bacterium]